MKTILIILGLIVAFWVGWLVKEPKTITEQVKVYSLPDGVPLDRVCENIYQKKIQEVRDEEFMRLKEWRDGFKAGRINQ